MNRRTLLTASGWGAMVLACRRRNASYQGGGALRSETNPKRPSYPESVAVLKGKIDVTGDALPEVTRTPRFDDDQPGPSVFRAQVEDVSLEGLTLPGLYVCRSELGRVSFKTADLHLSAFNWSDIIDCTFDGADLSRADLRACHFVRCTFNGAVLAGADLRGSTFVSSTFVDADLRGALLHRLRADLPLTLEQRRLVTWSADAPEPGGG